MSISSPHEITNVSSSLSAGGLQAHTSYYRSQFFMLNDGINPLIAAATSLFTILARLIPLQTYQNLPTLHAHLVHEVNAFMQQAKNKSYSSETILLARYAICATLDEGIQKTPWADTGEWQAYQLLTAFHREASADDRFFTILERLCDNPDLHRDVIELYYLCLQTGFQGKYQHSETERHALTDLTERLYRVIREQRGPLQKELHLSAKTNPVPPGLKIASSAKRAFSCSRKTLWGIGLGTLLAIHLIFTGYVEQALAPLSSAIVSLNTAPQDTSD